MKSLLHKFLVVGCSALTLVGTQALARADSVQERKVDFRPGQIWRYQTRPHEPKSRILIQRVDPNEKLGEIVHIRVTSLAFKGPRGKVAVFPHLPFSGKALRNCVVALESSGNEVPTDYMDGYKIWREAFDAGKGGVFTVDVASVLDAMEKGASK
jgi:hypothetical protein